MSREILFAQNIYTYIEVNHSSNFIRWIVHIHNIAKRNRYFARYIWMSLRYLLVKHVCDIKVIPCGTRARSNDKSIRFNGWNFNRNLTRRRLYVCVLFRARVAIYSVLEKTIRDGWKLLCVSMNTKRGTYEHGIRIHVQRRFYADWKLVDDRWLGKRPPQTVRSKLSSRSISKEIRTQTQ